MAQDNTGAFNSAFEVRHAGVEIPLVGPDLFYFWVVFSFFNRPIYRINYNIEKINEFFRVFKFGLNVALNLEKWLILRKGRLLRN